MKTRTFTLLLFFLTTFQLQAQGLKTTISVGYGTSYHSNEGLIGKKKYAEIERAFNKPISMSLGLAHIKASKTDEFDFEKTSKMLQGDLNLYFSPIHNKSNKLKFGVGGTYRFAETNFTDVMAFNDYGFTASVGYEVFLLKHVVLGSKASFHQYQNKDRIFYWGLNAGVRF